AAARRGRAGDDEDHRAILVGEHLVVDVGGAAQVAAGKAHLAHRLDDRARVEALDVDMLDGRRQQLRLAGVVGEGVGGHIGLHPPSLRGAKRRSNPAGPDAALELLRYARNDEKSYSVTTFEGTARSASAAP